MSDMDAHMLEECIAEERRLFKEQEKCRDELSRLAHLIWLKLEEREQKSRDVQNAQVKNYLIIGRISEVKAGICRNEITSEESLVHPHFPLYFEVPSQHRKLNTVLFYWQFIVQCNSILKYHAATEMRYLKGYFLSSLWNKETEKQIASTEILRVQLCVYFTNTWTLEDEQNCYSFQGEAAIFIFLTHFRI